MFFISGRVGQIVTKLCFFFSGHDGQIVTNLCFSSLETVGELTTAACHVIAWAKIQLVSYMPFM